MSEKEEIVIAKRLLQNLNNYKTSLNFMYMDVPIETLCLSKSLVSTLHKRDIFRVYDLWEKDLFQIEGISEGAARNLTTRRS